MTRRPQPALIASCAALAVIAAPSTAFANHHFYQHVRTSCVAKENPYTGGYLIAARTKWQMGTRAHKDNNLRSVKVQARLIPTGPGTNVARAWAKAQNTLVTPDGYNKKNIAVTTNFQSDSFDWNLELKFTWDRKHKGDWNYKQTVGFAEDFCDTGGGF